MRGSLAYVTLRPVAHHKDRAILLFLIRDEIFARCQPLERQPQAQIVKHQALQLASQHLPRVAYRERWLLQDLPGDLPGTRQELIARHHLADQPKRSRLMRRDLFAREQEVASPIEAKQQREDHLHAIAGDQPAREVRQILKYRIFGGEYDVAQKGEFCMNQGGAVDGRYHRGLDIEMIHDQVFAVGDDVIPRRRRDFVGIAEFMIGDKYVGCAGDYHHFVLAVPRHVAEGVRRFMMRVEIPDYRSAVVVKRELQDTVSALHLYVLVLI